MKTNQFISAFAVLLLFAVGCNTAPQKADEKRAAQSDAPEYFLLGPNSKKRMAIPMPSGLAMN